MGKYILYIFIWLLVGAAAHAQATGNLILKTSDADQIPKEKVFMHYSTSIIFPGEYLYYSFYCLYDKKYTASQLSKIGYVELVSEDREIIMRQKLTLKNGISQGDYFIPTDVPSGNYKLVAYTQWMRNVGLESFFKADITILNPYQGNQENLRPASEIFTDTIKLAYSNDNLMESSVGGFNIATNKDTYSQRERVALKFDNLLGESGHGNYSISVRQIASQFERKKLSSKEFLRSKNVTNSLKEQELYLPELRGTLLPLKIVSETEDTLENVNVSMSIPGENYIFKIANSDTNGNVFFNLSSNYEGEKAVFQILDDSNIRYSLMPNNYTDVNYIDLSFDHFKLNEEIANLILERSVQNQIENAFIALKKDTIVEKTFSPVFNYEDAVSYNLNDYTRFKTIKETMVEIIKDVWTTRKEGKDTFQIRWTGSDLETVVMPLLLLDGMVIQDHQFLSSYDSRKIKIIKVLKGTYIFGEMVYDGVLVFESEKPLKHDEIYLGEVLNMNLLNPEVSKSYFHPRYDVENKLKLKKIPDYRRQLFWKPNLRLDEDALEFDFYSSDVLGTFLIELEGFTDSGRAVSISKLFKVE